MEYAQFEQNVCKYVPGYLYKQFRHILRFIPKQARYHFISLIRKGCDFSYAILSTSNSTPEKNRVLTDLVHQRMQDNMSEIQG